MAYVTLDFPEPPVLHRNVVVIPDHEPPQDGGGGPTPPPTEGQIWPRGVRQA